MAGQPVELPALPGFKAVGQTVVGLTQVTLPATPCKTVILVPHQANTGFIYIIDTNGSVSNGCYIPAAGLTLPFNDLSRVTVISTLANQRLTWMAF